MITRYIYGLRGVLTMLAVIFGLSCLTGTMAFFVRTPPIAPLTVPVGLVAICAVFVFVVGVLWVHSLTYWSRAKMMEDEYWRRINAGTNH